MLKGSVDMSATLKLIYKGLSLYMTLEVQTFIHRQPSLAFISKPIEDNNRGKAFFFMYWQVPRSSSPSQDIDGT